MRWIACFSQSGKEISELVKIFERWPDEIYTNNFDVNKWHHNIPETMVTIMSSEAFYNGLRYTKNREFITLHGWLSIIPSDVCEMHNIYNGHPGAIHLYPELRGKDPQEKVWHNREKYNTIGSVVHKVTAEVDCGEIIKCSVYTLPTSTFAADFVTKDTLYGVLRETSIEAWKEFLMENLDKNAIRPSHYKGMSKYECINVIEELCKVSENDRFTDYNRFQAFKYVWRAGNKDPVVQDLRKAITFLQFAVAYEEGKNNDK